MIRTNEQIRELIAAGKSFWVGTENERKFAKTIGGKGYVTTATPDGFNVCKLPEVQKPGGKGRK